MTALRTTATDRPEEPRMSDPMAAALARLHAEHPHLPADGGPVWEPVQDDGEEHHTVDGIRYLCHPDDHYCPTAPAEACQLHSPTGDPCDCGHDTGAEGHPKERRTA